MKYSIFFIFIGNLLFLTSCSDPVEVMEEDLTSKVVLKHEQQILADKTTHLFERYDHDFQFTTTSSPQGEIDLSEIDSGSYYLFVECEGAILGAPYYTFSTSTQQPDSVLYWGDLSNFDFIMDNPNSTSAGSYDFFEFNSMTEIEFELDINCIFDIEWFYNYSIEVDEEIVLENLKVDDDRKLRFSYPFPEDKEYSFKLNAHAYDKELYSQEYLARPE